MGANPQGFKARGASNSDTKIAVIEATMVTRDEFHTVTADVRGELQRLTNNMNQQLLSMQKTINEQTWKIMGGIATFMTVGLSVLYFALRH